MNAGCPHSRSTSTQLGAAFKGRHDASPVRQCIWKLDDDGRHRERHQFGQRLCVRLPHALHVASTVPRRCASVSTHRCQSRGVFAAVVPQKVTQASVRWLAYAQRAQHLALRLQHVPGCHALRWMGNRVEHAALARGACAQQLLTGYLGHDSRATSGRISIHSLPL